MNDLEPTQREQWGTKIGFILAATGSAIGLGNVWKFPYITGENGGAAFVLVYALFFSKKGPGPGLAYGLLFGLGSGVAFGYGCYCVMPITLKIANVWFLGTIVEGALGGLVAGLIVRK